MIKKKELKIKKQLVDSVHVNSNGAPRAISVHEPTDSYPGGYYYTRLDGRKTIKAKDLSALYDRLYDHYYGKSKEKNTVKRIFQQALDEKRDTENPKEATLYKYKVDFNSYISEELSDQNIELITAIDLRQYTQHLVNSKPMTKKQFLAYKGVLNLIFRYALDHDIIRDNPVHKIKNAVYLKSCDTSHAKAEEKIFLPEEIEVLVNACRSRIGQKRYGEYYISYYALQFSVQTGCRVGEICALRWDDIDFDASVIHIHAQQLMLKENGHQSYYYVPYTKNECGISQDGRYFPLTQSLRDLFAELAELQRKYEIQSEYVFCNSDGEWITTTGYESFFRRLCRSCGFKITNNHALRMSLNSNVLIQGGVAVTDRANLLGHSVATNLNYYSYAQKDYVDKAREVLENSNHLTKEPNQSPKEPNYAIEFNSKKALKRLV